MKLTTKSLALYIGGQMEIQNRTEGYVFRGEIESAEVVDNTVKVKFAWLGKGKDYPPIPTGWVNADNLEYAASTEIYVASDIGDGRIAMNSLLISEAVVFYPLGGSRLDPSKVEGLQLAA